MLHEWTEFVAVDWRVYICMYNIGDARWPAASDRRVVSTEDRSPRNYRCHSDRAFGPLESQKSWKLPDPIIRDGLTCAILHWPCSTAGGSSTAMAPTVRRKSKVSRALGGHRATLSDRVNCPAPLYEVIKAREWHRRRCADEICSGILLQMPLSPSLSLSFLWSAVHRLGTARNFRPVSRFTFHEWLALNTVDRSCWPLSAHVAVPTKKTSCDLKPSIPSRPVSVSVSGGLRNRGTYVLTCLERAKKEWLNVPCTYAPIAVYLLLVYPPFLNGARASFRFQRPLTTSTPLAV